MVKNGRVKYDIYDEAFSNSKELGEAIKLPEQVIEEQNHPFVLWAYPIGLNRVNIKS